MEVLMISSYVGKNNLKLWGKYIMPSNNIHMTYGVANEGKLKTINEKYKPRLPGDARLRSPSLRPSLSSPFLPARPPSFSCNTI
jgi:hypothetical protein